MSTGSPKPDTAAAMTAIRREKIRIPRLIWVTALKFSFVSFLLIGSFEVLFVIGKDSILLLSGNPALSGLPVSVHSLGGLLLVIPMGIVTDRVSRKFGIMLSALLNVLGLTCLSFSIRFHSLALFFGGLFVLGVGTAGVQITSLVGTDIFPPERKTEGMAVIVMGGGLGAFFGPLMGGAVLQLSAAAGLEPIATTWLSAAGVSVLAFFVALSITVNPKHVSTCPELYYEGLGCGNGWPAVASGAVSPAAAGGDGENGVNPKSTLKDLRNHIFQFPILVSLLAIVMAQGIRLSLLPHLSPIMVSRGMTAIMASASVSAMSIGGIIICYPGGRIIDFLGRRRIMLLSGLGLAACALAVTNLMTYGLIMIMLILMGLFRSLCNLAGGAMITDVVPVELKGTLFALRSIVMQVTIIIIPLLSGFLINRRGFGSIGYLGICLALPALAALLVLKETSIGEYGHWVKRSKR